MKCSRRSLLRSASASAVAFAGCITRSPPSPMTGESESTTGTSGSTAETGTVATTTGEQRETELSGEPFSTFRVDPTPSRVPLAHSATFVSGATESTPARIRVTVANPSGETHAVRTGNYGLPFPNPVSETTPDGTNLVLAADYDDPAEGCWQGYGEIEPMAETAEVAPDETIQGEYYVLDYAENPSCWPPGAYRFEVGYTLDPDGEAVEYQWGFELAI